MVVAGYLDLGGDPKPEISTADQDTAAGGSFLPNHIVQTDHIVGANRKVCDFHIWTNTPSIIWASRFQLLLCNLAWRSMYASARSPNLDSLRCASHSQLGYPPL